MKSSTSFQLVWFRDDLRIMDNPALLEAMGQGPTIAVFILDESSAGIRPLGAAAKWWLHHALEELTSSLGELGVPLILRSGPASQVISELCREVSIAAVRWNRRYGPAEIQVDALIKQKLAEQGVSVQSYPAYLLKEPWEIVTRNGQGYKVFTPFYNRLLELPIRSPLPVPMKQVVHEELLPSSEHLSSWKLLPIAPNWATGIDEVWSPGETEAQRRLELVLDSILDKYQVTRDRPDVDGSTALSPALRWGHLSVAMLWSELRELSALYPERREGCFALRRQIAWRDFCWHLLFHNPEILEKNLRAEFDNYGWIQSGELVEADNNISHWRHGSTGYAMVDAGMRQLWSTGWMHNRVRMITASFLVKNLGIHWNVGERWFWDTLVDADLASNAANWQWVAGSGADASPFFRIFNPELQARKFDPQGLYRSRFAPIGHQEIVDLKISRQEALDAYERMRNGCK